MTFVGDVYMALVHWKWGLSEDANECISYKARKRVCFRMFLFNVTILIIRLTAATT